MVDEQQLEATLKRIMGILVQQNAEISELKAQLATKVPVAARVSGERPNRDVAIDPTLAIQAYEAHWINGEGQKSIRKRLHISISKLRGVLAWSEPYFQQYKERHSTSQEQ